MSDTKVITVMCAARLPELLVKRIDQVAESGGVSRAQFIAEACRMRLDGANSSKAEHLTHNGQDVGSTPASRTKPDMQALRDICAGNLGITDRAAFDAGWDRGEAKEEVPICGKTWWEDGEQYECLMDKGHREAKIGKHGLRGLVRTITP